MTQLHIGAEVLLRVNRQSAAQSISGLLGSSAPLRCAAISFVMSVRQNGTTRFPLDGFLWNFTLEGCWKICQENSSFIKICQE
jgi:hypothetical protein